jgi:streptomycin 6-kinase
MDASSLTSQNTGVTFIIPGRLAAACRNVPERASWLARLPDTLRELQQRWSLRLGVPFDGDEASCAWVGPAMLTTGQAAVLKLGMPHMEGEQEIDGLRFWL